MSANLLAIFYLVSGVLFILALRGLSSPETSRKGNLYGIIGMAIAISVTILSVGNFSIGFIYLIIFLAIGGSIDQAMSESIAGVGGVLLVGVGINLLGIKQIPVGNYILSLFIPFFLTF